MSPFVLRAAGSWCVLALAACAAHGQSYTGTFTMASQQGGEITLVLHQGADGQLTGSMAGNGARFQVEGMVEEGSAMGAITGEQGGVFFEAALEGNRLTLTLIEVGAGNMPDYSTARTLVLERARTAAAPPIGAQAPAPAPPAAGTAEGTGGLLGRWTCRTETGTAQLAFVSGRELMFNGERTSYELAAGVIRVPGDFGPVEYRYELSGDQLAVTAPDRSTMRCQRQATAVPDAGTGLAALLRGPRCAYSSSPDGGFSTLYKLVFDGQGRFVSGTESSFSGDPGYAYGLHNDPNAGTYQVMGTGRGAEIHLTWPDGSTGVATVYVGDASMIREFRLNGRHYGPGLCE